MPQVLGQKIVEVAVHHGELRQPSVVTLKGGPIPGRNASQDFRRNRHVELPPRQDDGGPSAVRFTQLYVMTTGPNPAPANKSCQPLDMSHGYT
jgi:hypothetical protein